MKAEADANFAELRAMFSAVRPIQRAVMMAGASIRSVVSRVVWHIADLIERLDTLHADLIALQAAADPLVPLAGTLTGVGIGTQQVMAPSGGTVERVVLTNTGGGAVELELRLGAVRVDYLRLAPNDRVAVGPLYLTAVLYCVPISGSVGNLAATLWSVIYR